MITTCGRCGGLYEAGSEEQANEPGRLCKQCFASPAPRKISKGVYTEAPRFYSPAWSEAMGMFLVGGDGISPLGFDKSMKSMAVDTCERMNQARFEAIKPLLKACRMAVSATESDDDPANLPSDVLDALNAAIADAERSKP